MAPSDKPNAVMPPATAAFTDSIGATDDNFAVDQHAITVENDEFRLCFKHSDLGSGNKPERDHCAIWQ